MVSINTKKNTYEKHKKTYDIIKGAVEIRGVEVRVKRFPESLPLEGGGESAGEAEDVDESGDAAGPGLGAQHFAPHWVANGDVALHGERNRQPYRRAACEQSKQIPRSKLRN